MVGIPCACRDNKAVIKVVGVGGSGGSAVNNMCDAGVIGVELIALDTDAQCPCSNKAHAAVQIGENITKGLGAGGAPEKGREAALESQGRIREALAGADLIFIAAGMGGGTGTGGGPVVSRIAKETGALVIGVVTRPFEFEGKARADRAVAGIMEMRNHVDSLLIIPNERLFDGAERPAVAEKAFQMADDVLWRAIQGISDLITQVGSINLDFADVIRIMGASGVALIGIGEAAGPDRCMKAAMDAIHSPLLEKAAIESAKGVLVNFTGSRSGIVLAELKAAMEFIMRSVSPDAMIRFGQAYDDSMGDRIRITVVAAGLSGSKTAGISNSLPEGGSV